MCEARCTDEWCGLALWDVLAWCVRDLWCTALDEAAATGEAVNAAIGRTRPSRANRCLREGVTGQLRVQQGCGKRLSIESKKHA